MYTVDVYNVLVLIYYIFSAAFGLGIKSTTEQVSIDKQ